METMAENAASGPPHAAPAGPTHASQAEAAEAAEAPPASVSPSASGDSTSQRCVTVSVDVQQDSDTDFPCFPEVDSPSPSATNGVYLTGNTNQGEQHERLCEPGQPMYGPDGQPVPSMCPQTAPDGWPSPNPPPTSSQQTRHTDAVHCPAAGVTEATSGIGASNADNAANAFLCVQEGSVMHTAIYLRVSSKQQDTRSQEADLTSWAASEETKGNSIAWYKDNATGTNFERDGWKRLEQDVNAGRVSRVVVWRLDRLGRTAGQTITLLDSLEARGIGFISIRDGFDPSTPAGRLMRNLLASVAQFETEVRGERQRAGIDAAKAAGKTWGGRRVGTRLTLTIEREQECHRMRQDGKSVAAIARTLGLSRKTVYAALARPQEV